MIDIVLSVMGKNKFKYQVCDLLDICCKGVIIL